MPIKTKASAKRSGNATGNRNAKTTSKAKGKVNATSVASSKVEKLSSKRKRPAEALDEGTDEEKNSDADGKEGPKRKGKANAKAGASSSDKTSEAPAQKKQRTENAQANKPGSFEAAKNAPTATNAAAKNTAKPTQDVNADIHVPITTPTTPSFTGGAFDIYAMQLPFLQKALKRTSSSKENYAALHTTILEYQAKPDNSGQIAISVPSDTSTNGYGRLSSGMFTDPMEDERYEIGLASLKSHPELKFTAKEKNLFFPDDANTIPKGEGISATLVLEEDMCTISGISGELKMSTVPVWKGGEGDNDGVLYQGVVSFSVRYSGLLSRKGHGSGADLSVGLWLVPSKETKRLDCDGVEHLANQTGSKSTGGGYDYASDDDLDGWDDDEAFDSDGYPRPHPRSPTPSLSSIFGEDARDLKDSDSDASDYRWWEDASSTHSAEDYESESEEEKSGC
ncbi:hypothetical protein AAF712_010825 [Marasmius tenuissimus]|uniref:Uncharacterized protein n=1 Tax=Marasmius tenuissimus TaxID=585030 RepID=A0ABR2ZMT0_9AGAR